VANRVYFAFHYQDVIDFRANVVRKHWVTKLNREQAGFFDASLWEEAEKTSDLAIKRMINSGLDGTSVTCVLVGSKTYERRWVQYEIFKSLAKGNALFGVNINAIWGRDCMPKALGPNPFKYLGYNVSDDGSRIEPVYREGDKWHLFQDVTGYSVKPWHPSNRRRIVQLEEMGFTLYDWVVDNGYNNFAVWVDDAAEAAGK
jgi:hypothetical protein